MDSTTDAGKPRRVVSRSFHTAILAPFEGYFNACTGTLELMYWNSTQKRWFKKYRGKTYAASPRTVGCKPTKEASRQAANESWARKLAEIDEALGKAKRHPANLVAHYEEAIENHRLFAKWHRKYGNLQEAERSEEMMEWLKEALASDTPPFL